MFNYFLQTFHNGNGSSNEYGSDDNGNLSNFCSKTKHSVTENWIPKTRNMDSVLVCTGVSSPEEDFDHAEGHRLLHKDAVFNPSLRRPKHVAKNILDAVEMICKQEGLR